MKPATLLLLVMWTGWIVTPKQVYADLDPTKIAAARDNVYKEVEQRLSQVGPGPPKDCDDGKKFTKLHQVWLYTNYRGVFEYRLHGHDYSVDVKTKKDVPDSPTYAGSVLFLNIQTSRMKLTCPCKGSSFEWKMYGKESKDFKKDNSGTKRLLTIKAPHARLYYRTYSCTVDGFTHYFNVFTRPLGLTTVPPLMFTEGIPGPADKIKKVACNLTMYQNLKKPPAKFVSIQAPFTFYWQFPGNEPGKVQAGTEQKKDESSKEANRPPKESSITDSMYWAKGRGDSSHPPIANSISYFGLQDDKGESSGSLCKASTSQKVVLSSDLKVMTTRAEKVHAGVYACIVEDRNGLSSAYWWDGDEPPSIPYRGFTHIRVRGVKWVFIAIAAFCGLGIVLVLMIFLLPDNKEDFTEDPAMESSEPPMEIQIDGAPSMAPTVKTAGIGGPDPEGSRANLKPRVSVKLKTVESVDLMLERQGAVMGGMIKGIGETMPSESSKSLGAVPRGEPKPKKAKKQKPT